MNIKGEHIHILLTKKKSLLQKISLFRLETAKTRKNIVFSKQFKYSDIDPIRLF